MYLYHTIFKDFISFRLCGIKTNNRKTLVAKNSSLELPSNEQKSNIAIDDRIHDDQHWSKIRLKCQPIKKLIELIVFLLVSQKVKKKKKTTKRKIFLI